MKIPPKALLIAVMIMCFAGPSYCISSEEYSKVGDQYFVQGNYARALSCYEEALKLSPGFGDGNFYSRLAIVYTALGDKGKAIECLKRTLELRPGNTWIYNKIANLYMQTGRHEDAVEFLKKYSQSYPDDANTYYVLGSEYVLLGKKNDAIRYFEKARKMFIESDDPEGVARAREAIYGVNYSLKSIVAGPYLQNVNDKEATIIWWTDFSADTRRSSSVEYRLKGEKDFNLKAIANELSQDSTDFNGLFKQEARLTGLSAGQEYEYRVLTSGGKAAYIKGPWTFRTAPGRYSGIRFSVLGDGMTDDESVRERHRAVFNAALGLNSDFILYCGDMVKNGSQDQWKIFLRQVMCDNDKTEPGSIAGHMLPVYMVVGNREIYDGRSYLGGNIETSMKRFRGVCDNPDNGSINPDWRERYYAFSYGPCYFIVLDANNTSSNEYDNNQDLDPGDTPDWEPGSEQYKWLVERLKHGNKNYAFTFVAFHPAPYSRGKHGSPDDQQSGYQLRALDPLFREYGVDTVFAAHDHIVERSVTGPRDFEIKYEDKFGNGMKDPRTWRDENNLNYITQGNSGEESRKAEAGWKNWMSVRDDKKAPFYTVYYYSYAYDKNGWEYSSDYSSLSDVTIVWNEETNKWRAVFKVVRTDVKGVMTGHDGWWMERSDPLRPKPAASQSAQVLKAP